MAPSRTLKLAASSQTQAKNKPTPASQSTISTYFRLSKPAPLVVCAKSSTAVFRARKHCNDLNLANPTKTTNPNDGFYFPAPAPPSVSPLTAGLDVDVPSNFQIELYLDSPNNPIGARPNHPSRVRSPWLLPTPAHLCDSSPASRWKVELALALPAEHSGYTSSESDVSSSGPTSPPTSVTSSTDSRIKPVESSVVVAFVAPKKHPHQVLNSRVRKVINSKHKYCSLHDLAKKKANLDLSPDQESTVRQYFRTYLNTVVDFLATRAEESGRNIVTVNDVHSVLREEMWTWLPEYGFKTPKRFCYRGRFVVICSP